MKLQGGKELTDCMAKPDLRRSGAQAGELYSSPEAPKKRLAYFLFHEARRGALLWGIIIAT